MKKNISVKPITERESALLIAKSLPDYFNENGIKTLERDLELHDFFGAFVGDKLVGFITLRKTDIASLEISWLAILKEFQGQGIGKRLVKETLNSYVEKGYNIAYVKTLAETVKNKGYEQTRKFYKLLGFQTLEIINPYPSWEKGNPCQILAASIPIQ